MLHVMSPKRLRVIVILFILVTGWCAPAQTEKALLWKVSGKDLSEPSYLFGTYHLLTDKFLTTTPEIKEPFKNTKGVVVEMILDSGKLQALGMKALMPDKKISDLISPEQFQQVSTELERLTGYQLKMLDQLKPVSVMIMMTLQYAQKGNEAVLKQYPGLPMDYFYAASGRKMNKAVTALETQDEQIDLLYNAFSIEEQARQLVKFVEQKDIAAQSQVDLLQFYLSKDLSGMYAYADQLPKDFGSSDFLLKDRNVKWMAVLPGLMKQHSQFIAVGALHLTGPDGLITLLRQQGYSVTAVP